MEIFYKEESFAIVGAAMEVHREMGFGFFELIYQEALEVEFALKKIPNVREGELKVSYKGHLLDKRYKVDFLCYEKIIVETKAVAHLLPEHEAQVLNYLKASGLKLGLLINFGAPSLEHRRIVR
jgi:GxxExxY protein